MNAHEAERGDEARGPIDWFPKALAIARHQDQQRAWPWYGRLFHKLFVSWRCPACIAAEGP
jgi:hypothetical protein